MNQLDNIERIESGSHDKTAGSSFRDQQEYADCVRRQRQAYDLSDLAEEVDEIILACVKDGNAVMAGRLLIANMNATIARRVAAEGWK
jgi:hypothetical protein